MNLPASDREHLKTAEGWLELGDHLSAFEHLERIDSMHHAHPDVLKLRVRIYMKARKWESAFQLADGLSRKTPDDVQVFVWRSECARWMPGGGILRALELLLDVSGDFPDEPVVPYTLARYNALLEKLVEAIHWLNLAFEAARRDGSAREWTQRATEEPDLAILHLKP